jgi:hypothetical protein
VSLDQVREHTMQALRESATGGRHPERGSASSSEKKGPDSAGSAGSRPDGRRPCGQTRPGHRAAA